MVEFYWVNWGFVKKISEFVGKVSLKDSFKPQAVSCKQYTPARHNVAATAKRVTGNRRLVT